MSDKKEELRQLLKSHLNITIELDPKGLGSLTVAVLFDGEEMDSDTVYLDDLIDERARKLIERI